MSDAVTTTGMCRNPACSKAAAGESLEWYAGPGEYCPECGEALSVETPSNGAAVPSSSFASLSPQEYRDFETRMLLALAPARRTPFWLTRPVLAWVAVVSAAAVTFAFLGAKAIPRRGATPEAIRVCRSSVTDRLAGDVVRTFAATTGTPASRFVMVRGGACDVRFSAATASSGAAVVGHDGIVVVVNPQNPVSELTLAQLRAILNGAVTDWAQLGGTQGTIVPMAPPEGSDESAVLDATLLHGGKLGGVVDRSRTSAEIVRLISAPSGRPWLGIVAFSAAAPAKVVRFRSIPAPSTLSIADDRYPFSLDVTVARGRAGRDPLAGDLLAYARSDAAQALVVRNGLVAKAGF